MFFFIIREGIFEEKMQGNKGDKLLSWASTQTLLVVYKTYVFLTPFLFLFPSKHDSNEWMALFCARNIKASGYTVAVLRQI